MQALTVPAIVPLLRHHGLYPSGATPPNNTCKLPLAMMFYHSYSRVMNTLTVYTLSLNSVCSIPLPGMFTCLVFLWFLHVTDQSCQETAQQRSSATLASIVSSALCLAPWEPLDLMPPPLSVAGFPSYCNSLQKLHVCLHLKIPCLSLVFSHSHAKHWSRCSTFSWLPSFKSGWGTRVAIPLWVYFWVFYCTPQLHVSAFVTVPSIILLF